MNFAEIQEKFGQDLFGRKPRRSMKNEEHRIQCSCIRWMKLKHPDVVIFAIPNGGARDSRTGAMLKEEGVLAGASDLMVMLPNARYNALCIEMKTPKGKQSEAQVLFQGRVEKAGYKYSVCHSLDEFISEIESYINDNPPTTTSAGTKT